MSSLRRHLQLPAVLLAQLALTTSLTAQFYGKETHAVGNGVEFAKAVGANRTLRLSAGRFDLSALAEIEGRHLRHVPRGATKSLLLRGLMNLRIHGAGKGRTELVVPAGHSFVLGFENCHNLELRDLRITTSSPSGVGNLLSFTACTNVLIRNCQLIGNGSRALELDRVGRLLVRGGELSGCRGEILSAGNSLNLRFQDCTLRANRGRAAFRLVRTFDARFDGCVFQDNRFSEMLFLLESSSGVRLIGTNPAGLAPAVANRPDDVLVQDKDDR